MIVQLWGTEQNILLLAYFENLSTRGLQKGCSIKKGLKYQPVICLQNSCSTLGSKHEEELKQIIELFSNGGYMAETEVRLIGAEFALISKF